MHFPPLEGQYFVTGLPSTFIYNSYSASPVGEGLKINKNSYYYILQEIRISQMFPRPAVQRPGLSRRPVKRILFCVNNLELPLVLNSLKMKCCLIDRSYNLSKRTRSLLPRPGGSIFSPYWPSKRGTLFKYERS